MALDARVVAHAANGAGGESLANAWNRCDGARVTAGSTENGDCRRAGRRPAVPPTGGSGVGASTFVSRMDSVNRQRIPPTRPARVRPALIPARNQLPSSD
jgi:hypothetical protein